ncbi:MAG: hypothetical protein JKY20_07220 [Alphaproteobacteria bacterium]|nr:hypothetical protein [Alphaproteobacteria bacterium]
MAFTVMPIVLILMVASHLKGYIKKKAKHPMMVGVLLWSVVHLIANGDRAALYLFGAFALFSVYSIVSSTRRGLAPTYESPNRTHDFIAIGAGGVLFAGILWGHGFLT